MDASSEQKSFPFGPPNLIFCAALCGSGGLLVAVALGLRLVTLGVSLPVACGLLSRSSVFSEVSKPGRGSKLVCVEAQKKGHRPQNR